MKRWKQWLACMLGIVMLAAPVSAEEADGPERGVPVEKLAALGVWRADWDLAAPLTRGGFADVIAELMNVRSAPVEYDYQLFYDVTPDSPHFASVMYLARLGVIAGGEGQTFLPEAAVTVEQAVKMTVSALGYGQLAELSGGYPAGYYAVANRYRLIPTSFGKLAGGELTFSDALALVEHAIDAPALKQTGYGAQQEFTETEGETVLSLYRQIEKAEGILSGIGSRSLKPDSGLSKTQAELGGAVFEGGQTVNAHLLGYQVEGYYRKEKDGLDTLIYVGKRPGKNAETIIRGRDIVGVENGRIRYENPETGRSESMTAGKSMTVVYNGNYCAGVTDEDFENADEIRFLDADGNGTDETLIVNREETIVVSGADVSGRKVYDRFGGAPLDLYDTNGTKTIEIYDADGKRTELSAIGEWAVLSVRQDRQAKTYEIRMSSETVSGTIESITNGGSLKEREYSVGGRTFRLANNAARQDNLNAFQAGTGATLYLNRFGEIAALRAMGAGEADQIGYVVQAKYDDNGMGAALLYLYLPDQHTLATVTAAEKIKLERIGRVDGREFIRQLCDNTADGSGKQLIRFRLNEEGYLRQAELPKQISDKDLTSETGELTKYPTYKNAYYHRDFKAFLGNFRIDENTMILYVPKSSAYDRELDSYNVKTLADFWSGSYYADPYNLRPDRTAGIVVIHEDSGGGTALQKNTAVTAVTKIMEVTDADGATRTKLCGLRGREEVEFLFAEGCGPAQQYKTSAGEVVTSVIERGDLVRFGTNANDEINDIYKVFSIHDRDDATKVIRGREADVLKEYTGSQKSTMIQYHGNAESEADVVSGRVWQGQENNYWFTGVPFSLEFGIVKEKHGGVLIMDSIGGPESDKASTVERYLNMNNRTIYVVDAKRDEVRLGDLNDIVPSDSGDTSGSSRVIYARYNDVPSLLVVIKR